MSVLKPPQAGVGELASSGEVCGESWWRKGGFRSCFTIQLDLPRYTLPWPADAWGGVKGGGGRAVMGYGSHNCQHFVVRT